MGGDVELVIVDTSADKRLDVPIWELGGKGVFVKEVQAAVLDGRADLAVHSGKDLPTAAVDGLALAAVLERGRRLATPTAAARRSAELRPGRRWPPGRRGAGPSWPDLRPDLTFAGLRGTWPPGLAKAAEVDAIVVAAVALSGWGLAAHLREVLLGRRARAPGRPGALAVECRADDDPTALAALAAIEHGPSRRAVDAERAFLAELRRRPRPCPPAPTPPVRPRRVGCRWRGLLASPDGHTVLRHTEVGAGRRRRRPGRPPPPRPRRVWPWTTTAVAATAS